MHPIYHYAQNFIDEYHDEVRPILQSRHPNVPVVRATPILGGLPKEEIVVAIVGGGVGGLYAAMLLQHCGIRYRIIEASSRLGGRLYTHSFTPAEEEEHAYFDVGAMRFPVTPLMRPVFRLFERIRVDKRLIDYYFSIKDRNVMTYNGIRRIMDDSTITTAQAFKIPGIPSQYSDIGWKKLISYVREPFRQALVKDFDTGGKEGWRLLMKYDVYSTRGYMTTTRGNKEVDPLERLPYPSNVVNWMETFNTSTNSWDHSLSDAVLESLAFSWPDLPPLEEQQWRCIDGGSSYIIQHMVNYLQFRNKNVRDGFVMSTRVRAIQYDKELDKMCVHMHSNLNRPEAFICSHVITTTTLPCLNTIDLSRARMTYGQHAAIRQITYGPATKIGVRFKTAWWNDAEVMQTYAQLEPMKGGQSSMDRTSRVVVYPSYGPDKNERSPVLIVSYAWTSDAQAWGALMGDDKESQEMLREIVLDDLVYVHKFSKEGALFLRTQIRDIFPFSWTRDPHTRGAYAYFGPGQYKTMLRCLTMPAAHGRLHFAGEAVSTCHAWVLGALNASARAVSQIVLSEFGPDSEEYSKLLEILDNEPPEGWTAEKLMLHVEASRDVEAAERAYPPILADAFP